MKPTPVPCPCGSSRPYPECCGLWHGGLPAPDAQALMRSRYAAYVQKLPDYLLATWAEETRPATLDLEAPPVPKWLGLQVLRHHQDGDRAQVEFVARYRILGRGQRLHETSRFVRRDGRWFYLDGDIQ